MEENLLIQLENEFTQGGALLDLLFVNRGQMGPLFLSAQGTRNVGRFSIGCRKEGRLLLWISGGQTFASLGD